MTITKIRVSRDSETEEFCKIEEHERKEGERTQKIVETVDRKDTSQIMNPGLPLFTVLFIFSRYFSLLVTLPSDV